VERQRGSASLQSEHGIRDAAYTDEMTVRGLEHFNITTSEEIIASCRAFYVDVLGLEEGPRPPFTSRGFWLYAGSIPVVHLSISESRTAPASAPLDHIAFVCENLDEVLARLEQHAVPHQVDRVPESGDTQLFLRDPAGVGLELNFASKERRAGFQPALLRNA
jgi:catechol 2,3-dioxygenase-like lactoylglutathione lyase family enzyme